LGSFLFHEKRWSLQVKPSLSGFLLLAARPGSICLVLLRFSYSHIPSTLLRAGIAREISIPCSALIPKFFLYHFIYLFCGTGV
jgi:hypothetical protein